MLLPDLKLNDIEEFKNFSLNEVFNTEYREPVALVQKDITVDEEFDGFLIIKSINGAPVLTGLPEGIEINETEVTEIKSYNPLLNLNNKYTKTIFDITFKKSLKKPVVLINFITGFDDFIPGNMRFSVEENGVIDLLEVTKQESTIDKVFINNRREFNIKNSVLNYTRVDEINKKTSLMYNYYGYIDNGTLNSVTLNNTGYFNMNNWVIDLTTTDSNCYIHGVVNLKDKMRHGSICKINHLGESCKSTQEFRHILDDECYAMYDGDITILNEAKNSTTAQNSKTIMLSNNARILNKPRLNIFTGEVKATHGATVGKLSNEDVFYLKQRGLPDRVIKELLIDAFVIDVLDRVQSEKIRSYLYDKR